MVNDRPDRRQFLTATASVTATVALAGCPYIGSGEDESFEAPHGATIEATRYGDGDCGVVLVPQINEDRASWRSQGETIEEMGHLALAIDEDPDDRPSSVQGAISYLREEHDVSTVALVGASSGCSPSWGSACSSAEPASSDGGSVPPSTTRRRIMCRAPAMTLYANPRRDRRRLRQRRSRRRRTARRRRVVRTDARRRR